MVYGQERLLKPDVEERFKHQLRRLRDLGLTARQIAKELEFGVEGSVYVKLKPKHVYFYVDRFQLKRKIEKKVNNDIDPRFKNLFFKYRKDMPEELAENLRKEGFLLNDPLVNINE